MAVDRIVRNDSIAMHKNLYPLERLVAAIVRQAIRDVYYCDDRYSADAIYFLKSEWFKEITGIDNEYILKELNREGLNV